MIFFFIFQVRQQGLDVAKNCSDMGSEVDNIDMDKMVKYCVFAAANFPSPEDNDSMVFMCNVAANFPSPEALT